MKNKREKRAKKIQWGQVGLHVFFIVWCATYILPLILIIGNSLSGDNFLKFSVWPEKIDFFAYEALWTQPQILLRAYGVTLFYSLAGVVLSLVVNSLFAYSVARRNFKLRRFYSVLLLFAMLMGGGMIGTYLVCANFLHIDDTIWVYIIPFIIAPWTVMVTRTFFQNLPEEIFESARMDGASEIRICFSIAMPMSVPLLATNAYGKFMAGWSDWITSSIYVRNPNLHSVQYVLKKYMDSTAQVGSMLQSLGMDTSSGSVVSNSYPIRYAMCVVGMLPALLLFPFVQKYFDKGMVVGSLKG